MAQKRHYKLERTAYHEAGHAVAAFIKRRRIRTVTIVSSPDTDTLGHVLLGKFPDSYHPDYDDSPKTRARTEREIIIDLAGDAAVQILTGRHIGHGADHDWQRAMNMACYITGSIEQTEAYINWLWICTQDLLRLPHYWAAVRALATELLAQRRIGERRARKIIANAISDYMKAELQAVKGTSQ